MINSQKVKHKQFFRGTMLLQGKNISYLVKQLKNQHPRLFNELKVNEIYFILKTSKVLVLMYYFVCESHCEIKQYGY